MFVLRRITSENLEINTCLDIDYVLVLKEKNKEEFDRLTKRLNWQKEEATKDVYGFITFDYEESIMPLYQDSVYFIMTSNGQTFANITKR